MLIFLIVFFIGSIFGRIFSSLSLNYIKRSSTNIKFIITSFLKCSACDNNLNPLFLIPVIGYFLVLGNCSKCRSKISKIYPLIEILYGALALILFIKFSLSIYSAVIFFIFGLSISISIIDLKTQIIPNLLLIAFFIFSIYPVILNNSLKENLYGFILMSIFFIIILLIFPGSFGGGDVKFASAIGILLGLKYSIIALEISLISGSVIGIVYAIITKRGLKQKIPFAPFLTIGLLIALLYGREILLIYYGFFY